MVNKKRKATKSGQRVSIPAWTDIGCLSHRKDTTISRIHNTIRQKK